MEKYIGRTVDIIYMDRYGQFSRRRVRVIAVQDNAVRAFDLVKRMKYDGPCICKAAMRPKWILDDGPPLRPPGAGV